MRHIGDCIAIVISAPSLPQATREQADLAMELSEAKIAACQDVVSTSRYAEAKQSLTSGMKVLFHQGGAPSKYDGRVSGVGRLTAAGCLGGIIPLGGANPPPDPGLLATTYRIFPGWELGGYLWFKEVRRIPNSPLTKFAIGRWPRKGENYIVICPGEQGYDTLLKTWESAYA